MPPLPPAAARVGQQQFQEQPQRHRLRVIRAALVSTRPADPPRLQVSDNVVSAATPADTNNKWQMLLEQNRDLSVVHGSIAAVAAAARRGADLRLYMSTDTYGVDYEEVMNFKQTLWRRHPDGDRFSGLGPFLSSVHHGQDIDAPYLSFFNYDTCRTALETPTHSLLKVTVDGCVLNESNYIAPANYEVYRWFVRDRYRVVYEHDAQGLAVSGDKEELKACVRAGQTIRVGVWQLSGLQRSAGNDAGAHEISYLETTQPFIPVANPASRSFFGRAGHAGEVNLACDLVIVPAPTSTWPLDFSEGLDVSSLVPSTSGTIVVFSGTAVAAASSRTQGAGGGDSESLSSIPPSFRRSVVRRAMRWMVADD